jgi:alpha-D-ribose 1-methylphosphonate 5-triphosphate synthase subunit PhnH
MQDTDLPGFSDPVAGAQQSFRALLTAMSRPGSLHTLGTELTPPSCLDPATAAVLLALTDNETTLWLDPALDEARSWIAFHSGTAFAQMPEQANFLLTSELPGFDTLNAGTDEGPEESATVITHVAEFGEGTAYRLSGPGLERPAVLRIRGLPDGFAGIWAANHALYPRGVDLVLCAGTMLMALPRSVKVEEV